jgi:hypothetical protein
MISYKKEKNVAVFPVKSLLYAHSIVYQCVLWMLISVLSCVLSILLQFYCLVPRKSEYILLSNLERVTISATKFQAASAISSLLEKAELLKSLVYFPFWCIELWILASGMYNDFCWSSVSEPSSTGKKGSWAIGTISVLFGQITAASSIVGSPVKMVLPGMETQNFFSPTLALAKVTIIVEGSNSTICTNATYCSLILPVRLFVD